MPTVPAGAIAGQSDEHLCTPADGALFGARVHRDVVQPLQLLQGDASRSGFDVRLVSGFRSFDEQLSIWNRKATGKRAVLDSDARPMDITTLTPRELVFAILRWSALPGASRHHWGTDLDVFDETSRPDGYEIELIPAEVNAGGMFGALHAWLDERIAHGQAHGFFRPYDMDRGGVAPERWHLSHAPTAVNFERALSAGFLRDTIQRSDIELRDTILENIVEIFERFVMNVNRSDA